MKNLLLSISFITLLRLSIVYGYAEETNGAKVSLIDPDKPEKLKLSRGDSPRDVLFVEFGDEAFQKQVQDIAHWLNTILKADETLKRMQADFVSHQRQTGTQLEMEGNKELHLDTLLLRNLKKQERHVNRDTRRRSLRSKKFRRSGRKRGLFMQPRGGR